MWNRIFEPFGSRRRNQVTFKLFLVIACILEISRGQYFDPSMDDKTYLDNLQHKIETEVNSTKAELYTQAKIVELMAKQFVAAQLKENLFIALRVLAEKELKEFHGDKANIDLVQSERTTTEVSVNISENAKTSISVYIRQEDGDDDDSETASAAAASATTQRAADAAMFQMGLIPQVANLIKAIFGGNQNINLTNYVSSATRLLPKPVGNQVVGLVSAISAPHSTAPTTANNAVVVPTNNIRGSQAPLVVVVPQNQNGQIPQRLPPQQTGNRIRQGVVVGNQQFQQYPNSQVPQIQQQGLQAGQSQSFPIVQPSTTNFQNGQTQNFQNPRPQSNPNRGTKPQSPQNSQSQSFQNSFNNIEIGSIGGSSTGKYKIRPQSLTTAKGYIYNPSGSKGVADATRKPKPQYGQQNQLDQYQQPIVPQFQPTQQQTISNQYQQIQQQQFQQYQQNPQLQLQNQQQQAQYQQQQLWQQQKLQQQQQQGQGQINQQRFQTNQQGQNQQRQNQNNAFPSRPLPNQLVQRPQQNQIVQRPQQNQIVQRPQQNQIVQRPQQNQIVQQRPAGGQNQQFPQSSSPALAQAFQQSQIGGPRPSQQKRPDEDEDDDYDEDARRERQFSLASLLPNAIGGYLRTTAAPPRTPAPVNPRPTNPSAQVAPSPSLQQPGQVQAVVPAPGQPVVPVHPVPAYLPPAQAPVPAAAPVAAATMPESFNLITFAQNVGKNVNDIIRIMPDLFRGAREGVQLLQTLSTVLGGFDGLTDLAGGIF